MSVIKRTLQDRILKRMKPGKVVILVGARRTGKTILIREVMKQLSVPFIYLNGEDHTTGLKLQVRSIEAYRNLIGDKKYLFIDEAPKIDSIGSVLKLMVDEIEGLHVMITGSSAFDIFNKTGEPLTGRKYTFQLNPISQLELEAYENAIDTESRLESRLLYGMYPEVLNISDNQEKTEYLNELISSYLLKDILVLDKIKNSSKLINILRLLAFQVGSEVSLNEISRSVGLNKATIDRYIDLLTKVFVIFRAESYSRNLRKEISKLPRYYFWDNGIRNALIANFNSLALRNDIGQLWENYIISERLKIQHYQGWLSNNYFWRTYDQQEVDWVEERDGGLFAFEIKFKKGRAKPPAAWTKTYPDAHYCLINKDNYLPFILKKDGIPD